MLVRINTKDALYRVENNLIRQTSINNVTGDASYFPILAGKDLGLLLAKGFFPFPVSIQLFKLIPDIFERYPIILKFEDAPEDARFESKHGLKIVNFFYVPRIDCISSALEN